MKDCTPVIASANLPNGVTYLLNMLLELEVPVFTQSFSAFWRHGPDKAWTLNPYTQVRYEQWLPALPKRQRVGDRNQPAVEWLHEWPLETLSERRIIFFIRDGRDALYSQFKRLEKIGRFTDFTAYLRHRGGALNLSPAHEWVLFHRLWLTFLRQHDEHLVVRFEDIKTNPLTWTQRSLDFLGIDRPAGDVRDAIEASDVRQAREHYLRLREKSVRDWRATRRGKVFEWKESWKSAYYGHLPAGFGDTLQAFGYEPADGTGVSSQGFDDASVVRQSSSWLRHLYSKQTVATPLGRAQAETLNGFLRENPDLAAAPGPRGWQPYYRRRARRRSIYQLGCRTMGSLHPLIGRRWPGLWRRLLQLTTTET